MLEVFFKVSIPDYLPEALLSLGVSLLCGLLIGSEREYRGKPAGLRTNILICMGSCLFMLVSIYTARFGMEAGFSSIDPGRIAAQVVTGIGFLGAGAIIRHKGGISGLTTAAGIWGMAAIGLAIGVGMYMLSIITSIGYIIVIEIFYYLAKIIRLKTYQYVRVEIIVSKMSHINDVRKIFRDMKLQFSNENTEKILGEIHYQTLVYLKGDMEDTILNKILKKKNIQDVQILNANSEL